MKVSIYGCMIQRFVPYLSIGVSDVLADLWAEFVYMWVNEGRAAVSVSFDD